MEVRGQVGPDGGGGGGVGQLSRRVSSQARDVGARPADALTDHAGVAPAPAGAGGELVREAAELGHLGVDLEDAVRHHGMWRRRRTRRQARLQVVADVLETHRRAWRRVARMTDRVTGGCRALRAGASD